MTLRLCWFSRVNGEEQAAGMAARFTNVTHMTTRQHAYLNNYLPRACGTALLSLLSVVGTSIFFAGSGRAQVPLGPDPTQTTSQPSTDQNTSAAAMVFGGSQDSANDRGSASTLSSLDAPVAPLPADQIIQILQQNPDLLTEVKSQIADHLQQQGTQVNAERYHGRDGLQPNTDERQRTRKYHDLPAGARVCPSRRSPDHGPGIRQDDSSVMQPGLPASGEISSAGLSPMTGATMSGSNLNRDGIPQTRTGIGQNRQNNPANRGREETNASTDAPKVLHQPTPYNLRSLHDLYAQIPEQTVPLKRFGSDLFVDRGLSSMARGSSSVDTPLDVPLGPDYVVGPGDTLTINMWGGMTQSLVRVIGRDGQILLPEAGSLQVAGLPLQRAGDLIEGALKQQYRNAQVSVTVSRLRSVRVYVVGDVQRPGGYDISSLATPLSALYSAGGPTAVGSLRVVRHYRGQKLIEDVDLYDFLLHGVQKGSARFESGDTLQVPPAGPQVAVSGAVKRPAIYELKPGESNLASVLDDAGGVTAAASLSHITIERIDANRQRETVTLKTAGGQDPQADRAAIDTFAVRDGDRIYIAPILPYSEHAIYLQGHVVRPGRLPYSDGMKLSDVLRSYQDMLPEPSAHGEIVRLMPPDFHAETIAFNVPEVLIGNANLTLQPFDTIRIFGRYEVDTPNVTIHGEVLRPGTYPLSKGMTAAQLVQMAGGFKRDALLEQRRSDELSHRRWQPGRWKTRHDPHWSCRQWNRTER